MNKRYSVIVLLSFFMAFSCFAAICDRDGKVLKDVVKIIRHYNPLIKLHKSTIESRYSLSSEHIDTILDEKTPFSSITLSDINAIGQVVFLRKPGLERKDIVGQENSFLPYTTEDVFSLFKSIGDIETVFPCRSIYRYILLNGSTVMSMRYRIKTLFDFIEMKKIIITPETEIVFLTGERDLFDTETEEVLMNSYPLQLKDGWEKSVSLPTTEAQAAEWIWNQAQLPNALKDIKITFVSANKVYVSDGAGCVVQKRPTTFDTIKAWIDGHNLQSGNCLSVSNQPYVYYQQATLYGLFKKSRLIEKGFTVDGAGMCTIHDFESFKKQIPVILDNFARTIYTELNNSAV